MATRKTLSDNPTPTIQTLDLEAAPEPFVYVTLRREKVTFPDPLEMETEQAEALIATFVQAREQGLTSREVLETWLGKEDTARILADKPSYRQMQALMNTIANYYMDSLGDLGESNA